MAWVDQHKFSTRLRKEIFRAFEDGWTVDIPSNSQPLIVLTKDNAQAQFEIGDAFPFDAPRILNSTMFLFLPRDAWCSTLPLHTYAETIVQRMALLTSIRD